MKKQMVLFLAAISMLACGQTSKHFKSTEDKYIDSQLKIIEAHKKQLVTAGRITDPEHFSAEMYLAEYGWHSSCGDSRGTMAIMCDSGSFGAYSFSTAAFEQAKKLYVIHGTVDAGSDILTDANAGQMLTETVGLGFEGTGQTIDATYTKGAFDSSIVGFNVGTLTYCETYGNHDRYCDASGMRGAKVIRYIDKGHVQLDQKAKHDAQMYGLVIAPADYIDMCACTVPSSPIASMQ